jgi:predicted aminopeptidase
MKTRARVGLLLLCLLSLSACSSLGYYSQAVSGHLKLMWARQPIDSLLADDDTAPELRQKLQTLIEAREFASRQLLLPDNDSYSTYVETGRAAVTWNVVAAGEFSLQARTWCFPVAGCVNYRGYFDKGDADSYAALLAGKNHDVVVGGAAAYSTLGWFDDPIVDTMLRGGEIHYVGTLFHELAHQLLYVKDDSNFNEAFASFVEQAGVRKWLEERGQSERIAAYDAALTRVEEFGNLLRRTRDALEQLYERDLAEEQMRLEKQAVFDRMRSDYEDLKRSWDGYAGYDNWFSRDLNNARLVAVATYRRYVPAFQAMFDEAGRDMVDFQALARTVAELPPQQRQQRLDSYLPPL